MASSIGWMAATPAARDTGQGRLAVSVLYLVATVGEWGGLSLWLKSIDAGHPWTANAWLLAGFAIERGAVAIWLKKYQTQEPGLERATLLKTTLALAFATAVEVAIWHVWRASATKWNVEIAGLLLFLMIHPLHAKEMASVRGQPLTKFIIRGPTILFSFAEALGGTVWLALVVAQYPWWGRIALVIALFIEHHHQGMELEDTGFRV